MEAIEQDPYKFFIEEKIYEPPALTQAPILQSLMMQVPEEEKKPLAIENGDSNSEESVNDDQEEIGDKAKNSGGGPLYGIN